MSPELDDKLVQKYPKIFADRHGSPQSTAMCWGFECDDGWYWLIDNMCNHIQKYIDLNKVPQVIATQVKQKFGTLRFYYTGGDEKIHGIVSHTEWLSGTICEECGTHEHVGTTIGWNVTLCKTHWLITNYRYWKDTDGVCWETNIDGSVVIVDEDKI